MAGPRRRRSRRACDPSPKRRCRVVAKRPRTTKYSRCRPPPDPRQPKCSAFATPRSAGIVANTLSTPLRIFVLSLRLRSARASSRLSNPSCFRCGPSVEVHRGTYRVRPPLPSTSCPSVGVLAIWARVDRVGLRAVTSSANLQVLAIAWIGSIPHAISRNDRSVGEEAAAHEELGS